MGFGNVPLSKVKMRKDKEVNFATLKVINIKAILAAATASALSILGTVQLMASA